MPISFSDHLPSIPYEKNDRMSGAISEGILQGDSNTQAANGTESDTSPINITSSAIYNYNFCMFTATNREA